MDGWCALHSRLMGGRWLLLLTMEWFEYGTSKIILHGQGCRIHVFNSFRETSYLCIRIRYYTDLGIISVPDLSLSRWWFDCHICLSCILPGKYCTKIIYGIHPSYGRNYNMSTIQRASYESSSNHLNAQWLTERASVISHNCCDVSACFWFFLSVGKLIK